MLKAVCVLKKASPILVAALFFSIPFALLMVGGRANAETVDYNVYIQPSLKITISNNPVVLNLNPNSKPFGTADVNVSVGTNNLYGYKLFMNTDSNVTSLERDSTADSITASIPTLSNGSSANPCNTSYTSSTFTTNSWGYRINNNVGGETNCIDTTNTNYYSYTPGTLISSSNQATNEQIASLTFASKIDYDKPAGEYELTLKMKALPTVTTYYMQDIASSPTLANTICTEEPTVVLDKRDEKPYTIRRINGDCWMVENLQFTGTTMDSTTSNISPQYTPSNPYRVNNGNGYGELATGDASGTSYIEPKIHSGKINITRTPINDSTSSTEINTVWYNYAAATAETITGESNTDPQLYDVCPAGWRMPNKAEIDSVGGGTSTHVSQFNSLLGGEYSVGEYRYEDTYGLWWTSSVANASARHSMYYNGSIMNTVTSLRPRTIGMYVRCIMNQTIGNITTLQQFGALSTSEKTAVKNSMATNKRYGLRDTRDDQLYTVAKINDGEVYMVDNLNIGAIPIKGNLTSTNTNLSTTIAKTVFEGWKQTGTSPAASYSTGVFVYIPGVDATAGTSYGTLYNYCAASANTICTETSNPDATADLCPSGWRIPTGGEGGEYQIMYNTGGYSLTSVHDSLANGGAAFAWAGEVGAGANLQEPGSQGLYWTATADNTPTGSIRHAFKFFTDPTRILPVNHSARNRTHSIRCRLR